MTPSNPLNALNFSGGPGALPDSVLQQVQEAIRAVPEVGLSILGISHRSDWFAAVVAELEDNIRRLMGLPADYRVLFLQGGATQQFTMLPMSLLAGRSEPADYLHTGYWSGKALPEARKVGPVRVVWSGEAGGFGRLPADGELDFNPRAPYLHYVSNETVEGLQFHRLIGRDDVPRICDMSSDFLSAPGDYTRFAMIYAHAQKNIGPAGVTVVILRDTLLADAPADLDLRLRELCTAVGGPARGWVRMAVAEVADEAGRPWRLIGTTELDGYLRPGTILRDGELAAGNEDWPELSIATFCAAHGFAPGPVVGTVEPPPEVTEYLRDAGFEPSWSADVRPLSWEDADAPVE